MSKVDADRAMQIYRTFTRQTDYVVQYLSVARQHEHQTRVEVPKVKHAPVNLGRQLEEYLGDPDFEVHRRQYLAELDAKKNNKAGSSGAKNSSATVSRSATTAAKPTESAAAKPTPAKTTSGGGDLIDFFGAIEQTQTAIPSQPLPQQQIMQNTAATPWGAVPINGLATGGGMFAAQPTGMFPQNGFAPQPTGFQSTNPFQMQATGAPAFSQPQAQQPLQPAYTGMGFGGFTAQPQQHQPAFQSTSLAPIPQDSVAAFQQQQQAPQQLGVPTGQQITNPFRLSMMATGMGSAPAPLAAQQTSTNPFARASPQASQPFGAPTTTGPPAPAPLVPTKTGTNPFARDYGGSQPQRPHTAGGTSNNMPTLGVAPLLPQPTGSTNPFRQSQFVNQQTGMGWQHNQQSAGLLGQLETIPVFPRPAQQAPWQ